MQDTAKEIVTECATITDPDRYVCSNSNYIFFGDHVTKLTMLPYRCEYASKLSDCLWASAAKRGIKSKPFL